MTLDIEDVSFFGHSEQDYVDMFNLTDQDLNKSILDCAGGVTGFSLEMARNNKSVICCDPIYKMSKQALADIIDAKYESTVNFWRHHKEQFTFSRHSLDDEAHHRLKEAKEFLKDFQLGLDSGRYRDDMLPNLNFPDGHFDIAVCSHFLFTYSDLFDKEFHFNAVEELVRVAKQVRIFPLHQRHGGESPLITPVMNHLFGLQFQVEKVKVDFEFQKGANEMIVISK